MRRGLPRTSYLVGGFVFLALAVWIFASRRAPARVILSPWLGADGLVLDGRVRDGFFPKGPVVLESTAPDGGLTAVAPGVSRGVRQVVTPEGGVAFAVRPGVDAFRVTVSYSSFVIDHVAYAYVSGDRKHAALPKRRFLFGAATGEDAPARLELSTTPGFEVSDVLLLGPGWRVEAHESFRVVAGPEVPQTAVAELAACVDAALEWLADARVPAPREAPTVLVIPAVPNAVTTRFSVPDGAELYVVEALDGLVASTVFRDLARAAVGRLTLVRPPVEEPLWRTLDSFMSLVLQTECELSTAELQRTAARRQYEAGGLVDVVLAEARVDSTVDWAVSNVVAVVHWERLVNEVGGLRRFLRAVLAADARSDLSLDAILAAQWGEGVAARFERLFWTDAYDAPEVPKARRAGFPFLADAIDEISVGRGDRLTLLTTGLNLGALDDCGCSVTTGGGLARRRAMIDRLRGRAPGALLLDLGEFLVPPASDAERTPEESGAVLEVLALCNYDALVPGVPELAAESDWMQREIERNRLPLTAANVLARDTGVPAFPQSRLVQRAGRTLRVIGLVEIPFERYKFEGIERSVLSQYVIADPLAALREQLANVAPEDVCVVAGAISPSTTQRILASDLADRIDVLLSSSWRFGAVLPELSTVDVKHLRRVPRMGLYGGTYYAYLGLSQYAVVESVVELAPEVGVRDGISRSHFLAPSVPRDGAVDELLARLAARLAGDPSRWKSTPLASMPAELRLDAAYSGAQGCLPCHRTEFDAWAGSPHSHALSSLAREGKDLDPECLRCHTTGFAWKNGYDPRSASRRSFASVQCEVCHGPAREHVRARSAGRAGPPVRANPARGVCEACHDPHNSPGFRFEDASVCRMPARDP